MAPPLKLCFDPVLFLRWMPSCLFLVSAVFGGSIDSIECTSSILRVMKSCSLSALSFTFTLDSFCEDFTGTVFSLCQRSWVHWEPFLWRRKVAEVF